MWLGCIEPCRATPLNDEISVKQFRIAVEVRSRWLWAVLRSPSNCCNELAEQLKDADARLTCQSSSCAEFLGEGNCSEYGQPCCCFLLSLIQVQRWTRLVGQRRPSSTACHRSRLELSSPKLGNLLHVNMCMYIHIYVYNLLCHQVSSCYLMVASLVTRP